MCFSVTTALSANFSQLLKVRSANFTHKVQFTHDLKRCSSCENSCLAFPVVWRESFPKSEEVTPDDVMMMSPGAVCVQLDA